MVDEKGLDYQTFKPYSLSAKYNEEFWENYTPPLYHAVELKVLD